MDYLDAATLFKSEDTQKQLEALRAVFPLLHCVTPSEDFLNCLIERGLSCEKSQLVRELSFQCVNTLYGIQVTKWSEVRAAVITEMGTAETAACLIAAIQILRRLPISDLVCFCGSKDGISVMKSCLLSDQVNIRAAAVENLGPLLLDAWIYVQSTNAVDGFISVESTSEARRFRDDISDLVIDMMKNFAQGLLGKAPGLEAGQFLVDHSHVTGAYFSVMGDLFERYCAKFDSINEWIGCILGAPLHPPPPEADPDVRSRSASLSLLMKVVLPVLLPDPYLLFTRWASLSFQASATSCISSILYTLLHSLPSAGPSTVSSCTLLFDDTPAMQFGSSTELDDTQGSRSTPMRLNVVHLCQVNFVTSLLCVVMISWALFKL
jgi:hypothetical protein